ncbi:MAG TPA: CTP synthase [Candidatus Woesebacteria bacterium]|nr:CTP synthase [Candidatus Woesebacteria bacterium]HNS94524.1 CTP synthase [Candidatus Woesebacteria bacterium]
MNQSKNTYPTKYIFISGGVISGIGKGVTSASIALILKSCGITVAPLKFENYLNVDSGTINPIEHGDVFLCEDGTEADMDVGTYEKFLDMDMGKLNYVTMGKIYKTVIDNERQFVYKGEDVEAIPHITQEILRRISLLEKKTGAQCILIELGGTAGEYQNILYYEAARQLTLQKPQDVIHVHVGYVPTPGHLGEPKTKPTQLSVRTLNSMGIQPDILVVRCAQTLDDRRKDRLALFCNMRQGSVFSNPDVASIYSVPKILADQHIHTKIFELLHMSEINKKPNLTHLQKLLTRINTVKKITEGGVEIVIVGKYFATGDYHIRDAYAALFDAIDHASWKLGVKVTTRWVSAQDIEKKGVDIIGNPHGIIVPIGWGSRGAEGMIAAAGYARTNKIPYLGLCYGMQLAVVSFARDVVGLSGANTSENDPQTPHPVIHFIPGQHDIVNKKLYGGTMRLGKCEANVEPNSSVAKLYAQYGYALDETNHVVSERHRHRYEFNDAYTKQIEDAGMRISGRSVVEKLVEFIELPQGAHPFYVATQGHPEYKSRPTRPHPLFLGFIAACNNRVK